MGAGELLRELADAGFSIEADGNRLVIRPWSKLPDELRAALRASKPEVLALLAAEHDADAQAFEERAAIMEFDGRLSRAEAEVAARECVDCEHFGRRRTCLEPVSAGLLTQAEGFGIVWPPEGHGACCAGFNGKTATAAKKVAVAKFSCPADPAKAHEIARLILDADSKAAAALHPCTKPFGDLELGSLALALAEQMKEVQAGDMKRAGAMLYGQAQALQAIFMNLARRAALSFSARRLRLHSRVGGR